MKKDNTIEKEINQIRLQIYEETKDMDPSELTEYYMKSAEAASKKYGLTFVPSASGRT
jgi:hypothetical protein